MSSKCSLPPSACSVVAFMRITFHDLVLHLHTFTSDNKIREEKAHIPKSGYCSHQFSKDSLAKETMERIFHLLVILVACTLQSSSEAKYLLVSLDESSNLMRGGKLLLLLLHIQMLGTLLNCLAITYYLSLNNSIVEIHILLLLLKDLMQA